MLIGLCCWQLWKRRDAVIFRNEIMDVRQMMLSCKREVELWLFRLPIKDRDVADSWGAVFDLAN